MKLSYVTVCVNYIDYLEVAYHHNHPHFNEFVVVTSPQDGPTQAFCAKHNLTCVITDAFYRNGTVFNKGLALNEGLNVLEHRDWVAIMDADTFVAPDFRAQIEAYPLDKEWFYGCERVLVPTWEDYQGLWTREIESYESPRGMGFGYFQLFNWQSSVIQGCPPSEWYPQSRDCTECDWRFYRMWGDQINDYQGTVGRMAKLPFKVFNLGPHGTNHTGRRSPTFSPSPIQD